MKWIIRGIVGLGVLVIVVLAVAAILLATFDPNDYKDRIIAAAEKATGRKIEIAGDFTTSFYPVLGFEVTGVSVGNPAGFEDETFITVGEAQAGVELLPLLHKEINISKIVLNQPAINVIRKADGTTNLAMGGKDGGEGSVQDDKTSGPRDISIGQIEINDARVTYNDKATGKTVRIDPLNMTLPGFNPGEETDIALDMIVKMNEPPLTVMVEGSATAKASPTEGAYSVSALSANIRAQSPEFGEPLVASLSANGGINTAQQTLDLQISRLKADWQNTDLTAKGTASGSFSQPRIFFSATAPTLNIDTLRATLGNKTDAAEKNPDGKLVPVELLRGLTLGGDIAVDELIVSQIVLTDLAADISAENGIVNIAPIKASFYDGKIDTALTIDARTASPVFTLKGAATGVEVGGLLQAKLGQDYLTGKAQLNYDLSSRGNTVQAMGSTAGGTIGFALGEGYINKWELSRRLNQAIAFFETGQLAEGEAPERIRFTSLEANFIGQDGVFRNDDLVLVGPKISALGAGTVSLASQTVDYTLRVGLGETVDGKGRRIPVRIYGPFSGLNYGIDVQGAVNELAGEKIEEKKQELIDKAFQKLGGDKPPAGEGAEPAPEGTQADEPDPAQQLLEGIFGR